MSWHKQKVFLVGIGIIMFIGVAKGIFPPDPRCDEILMREEFESSTLDSSWKWFNEPQNWTISGGKLIVYPEAETDFWSRSYYEFIHDNGHFLFQELDNSNNYTIYTKVTISPLHEFDQAGLMTRYNNDSWIKLSTEYINSEYSHLGSVATNFYSDWTTRDIDSNLTTVFYRMAKLGEDWVLHAKFSEETKWEQIRITHLGGTKEQKLVPLGIFACSPTSAGLRVEFDYVEICKFNTSIHVPQGEACYKKS